MSLPRQPDEPMDGSNACLMDGDHDACTLPAYDCICLCHRLSPSMETLKQDEISRQYQRDGAQG